LQPGFSSFGFFKWLSFTDARLFRLMKSGTGIYSSLSGIKLQVADYGVYIGFANRRGANGSQDTLFRSIERRIAVLERLDAIAAVAFDSGGSRQGILNEASRIIFSSRLFRTLSTIVVIGSRMASSPLLMISHPRMADTTWPLHHQAAGPMKIDRGELSGGVT